MKFTYEEMAIELTEEGKHEAALECINSLHDLNENYPIEVLSKATDIPKYEFSKINKAAETPNIKVSPSVIQHLDDCADNFLRRRGINKVMEINCNKSEVLNEIWSVNYKYRNKQ